MDLNAIMLVYEDKEKKPVVWSKKGKQVICFNLKRKVKDDNHFVHNCQ